jgi:hypothetical protein
MADAAHVLSIRAGFDKPSKSEVRGRGSAEKAGVFGRAEAIH